MNIAVAKTSRTIVFKSTPQVYVFQSSRDAHTRKVGNWVVRESFERSTELRSPNGSVNYSVVIETDVSTPEEIRARRSYAYELADDLNRVWTYVCGEPLNAARLSLVEMDAPPGWITNAPKMEKELQAIISGVTGQLSIVNRHQTYCTDLPLSKALDLLDSYRTSSHAIRTLVELHYSALISERSEARCFFYAKALEVVRAILHGRTDKQKQKSLPVDITNELHKSLHWLFDMANNRSDARHVVQDNNGPTIHPRMSAQEIRAFEHDADLVNRTVICMELGQEPFLVRHEKPPTTYH